MTNFSLWVVVVIQYPFLRLYLSPFLLSMLRVVSALKSSRGLAKRSTLLTRPLIPLNHFGTLATTNNAFTKFPMKKGAYDPALEKDSCGVGLVAHLKRVSSRQIVLDANQMLVRMSHRGGCGCEVNTGDGAGMFTT